MVQLSNDREGHSMSLYQHEYKQHHKVGTCYMCLKQAMGLNVVSNVSTGAIVVLCADHLHDFECQQTFIHPPLISETPCSTIHVAVNGRKRYGLR